ncbi:MAG TPA: hypothetical protein EYO85_01530, partial [Rhodospirillales bacterium]|nr:hypothetical protein [Rhodospirillales bacterium]
RAYFGSRQRPCPLNCPGQGVIDERLKEAAGRCCGASSPVMRPTPRRRPRRSWIAWSIAIWSAMTALCGMANSFWQLALAQWHVSQGFPDPTKTPLVRQVLKGTRAC